MDIFSFAFGALWEGYFWFGLVVGFFLGAWVMIRDQQHKELMKNRDHLLGLNRDDP